MIQENDAVIVIFSKEQVRQRKIAHFMEQCGPANLPKGSEPFKPRRHIGNL